MLSKKQKEANRFNYFEKAKSHKIKLILIGQDPYPDGNDNGIAFCKDDMSLLKRTSFPNICTSLGKNFKDVLANYKSNGQAFFNDLIEEGIVFLNLSYELLSAIDDKQKAFRESSSENIDLIKQIKSENPNVKIVRLGKSFREVFEEHYSSYTNIPPFPHPVGRAAKFDPELWRRIYKSDYLRREYLVVSKL